MYISFETHIFAPPPRFFRIIFFPLTHGLKTGVFSPKPIESSYLAPGGQNEKYTPLMTICFKSLGSLLLEGTLLVIIFTVDL